jgi:rod shape-determining protein MreD
MMHGTRTYFGWVRVAVVTVLALAATVAPLPEMLEPFRPNFVALTVLWFCLLSPRLLGLSYAWLAGLALDGFAGVLLGQHALTLTVIAYVACRLRLQIRAFPPLQQSAVILALLWFNEFLVFWIDGIAGHPITDWRRWITVPVSAACWPLVNGLFARYASRR